MTLPTELAQAIKLHTHLTHLEFQGRLWTGIGSEARLLIDYCLVRNEFRTRLSSTKSAMVEAFAELSGLSGLSVVFDTLCRRDDWCEQTCHGRDVPPAKRGRKHVYSRISDESSAGYRGVLCTIDLPPCSSC